MSDTKGRSYEKRFEVAAPVEAVWKAITEGEELTRWFCQSATCEPGLGGTHHVDWGGGMAGDAIVTVWEPNVHLRTEPIRPDRGPNASPPTEPYATDWFLEHEGGITRVRMVASGFGEGPQWDQEYDGTFHGWDMFHKTLRHYLENHRGQPSANVVIYATLSVSPDEAWARLMGAGGLAGTGRIDGLSVGSPFRFETRDGDVFEGVVQALQPGRTLAAVVESQNKAMLNLELTAIPGYGNFLYIALTTWGLAKPDVEALGERLKAVIFDLFPQQPSDQAPACPEGEAAVAG